LRNREPTRLEAFSDAAFAFALTLLVVSLEVPHSYGELMALARGVPSFACCFALLTWIWHEHNMFFRRYGLQDGYTVFLNSALLFVVLFYVYPLKFMFDSMFAMFAPLRARGIQPMTLDQLAHASALYAMGFIVLFFMFTLLYWHAYTRRRELALTTLEVFDVRAFAGHHIVSASVGILALLVAVAAPRRLAFVSPMCFVLMGPAHAVWGARASKKRRALEAQLHIAT
jgi:uncharacterized membrane protein